MKNNQTIDFFSSPTSKFIGFSDIRHHDHDLNNTESIFDQEQKKPPRKSSFQYYNYEAIAPLSNDFFNQKLQQFSQQKSQVQQSVVYEQQQDEQSDQQKQYQPQKVSVNPLLFLKNFIKDQQQLYHQHRIDRDQEDIEFNYKDSINFNNNMMEHASQSRPFAITEPERQGKMHELTQLKDQLQKSTFTSPIQRMYLTPKKKSEFFQNKKFYESTAEKQKLLSRSGEKGLRRLSYLAYSIVNSSLATTYKEVAQKLLTKLNLDMESQQFDDQQSHPEFRSIQNIKRRVYDSLNVLIALGVIKRIGNKITRQKNNKKSLLNAVHNSLLSGSNANSELERYNELVDELQKKVVNIQTKMKTEKELREKLQVFKRIVERNKKTKAITKKSKIIKLPFLAFVATTDARSGGQTIGNCKQKKQHGNEQTQMTYRIQWSPKSQTNLFFASSANDENSSLTQKKRPYTKRFPIISSGPVSNQMDNVCSNQLVTIIFKGFPQSYGDLDVFKLLSEVDISAGQFLTGNSSLKEKILKAESLKAQSLKAQSKAQQEGFNWREEQKKLKKDIYEMKDEQKMQSYQHPFQQTSQQQYKMMEQKGEDIDSNLIDEVFK